MYNNELYHFGVKGMKWGVRKARADRARAEARTAHKLADRYNNAMDRKAAKREAQAARKGTAISKSRAERARSEAATGRKLANKYTNAMDRKAANREARANEAEPSNKSEKKGLSDKQKTALKIGAAAAGTALVAYGAYKAKNAIHYKAYSKCVDEGMAAVNRMEKDLRSARIRMDMNAKRVGVDALDLFDAFTKRDERVVNDARRAVYKNASNATRTLGDSIRILRNR